ncbi:MAG: hypothetical protein ABIN94_12140 [Ferruginibacter sp.]
MKKQSYQPFTSLSKNELSNLTQDVKETIAFGIIQSRPVIFTAAELWNIQRQKKSVSCRRFL